MLKYEHYIFFLCAHQTNATNFHQCIFQDLPKRVKEIADFLEKPIDDDLCAKIADACSLKSMKRKRVMSEHFKTDSPGFIRKGKAQI